MTLFDLILIVIVAGFVMSGIRFGFIHTLGAIIGLFVGAYVASHHSDTIAGWIAQLTGVDIQQMGKWVTFLLIFFVVARLVGFLVWLAERSLNILIHLPFINSINHILGGFLGFFEGTFLIGLALFYAKYLPVKQITDLIAASTLAPWFVKTSKVLMPLIPEVVRKAMEGLI